MKTHDDIPLAIETGGADVVVGDFVDVIRESIIGNDLVFAGPLGDVPLHYFDWTASGRGLTFIERYLHDEILPLYANSHTEDDETGRVTTERLHQAESILKASVGADARYKVVHCGSGTTEAIHRLLQLLGIYVPPVLAFQMPDMMQDDDVPVVFIGPYEHHSNVVPWREARALVVEVPPDQSGGLCPDLVEQAVSDPRYAHRQKIGCFSAASNVTGRKTDVYEVTRRLKKHGALACFDLAAIAPYASFDVKGDGTAHVDAIVFSPHKFVGGPGASGVLIFHEGLYRKDLAPTFGGGGTVSYVGPNDHDFVDDIEQRETPGTPGILQVMRAALAMQVRDKVGTERIHAIEQRHLRRVMQRFHDDERIDVLGHEDAEKRTGIVAFNVRHPGGGAFMLHPRFVTTVLSDLFGIQTRAGCSCAGPYGHRLLGIDDDTSERYRRAVTRGCEAVKPGWVRASIHYTHTDDDISYLLDAIEFVAAHGARLLSLYEVGLSSGAWLPRQGPRPHTRFGLDDALASSSRPPVDARGERSAHKAARTFAMARARALVDETGVAEPVAVFPDDVAPLARFRAAYVRA